MSEGRAKVTLVVPVYNVEAYLERCMDSCARQTRLDLEILCVNDGSTDGSREILERYAASDSRIRILDRENGGVSAARNTGVDAACGEWIMFLDADDYLEPDACGRVLAESMEEETDIIVFGADYFPEAPAHRDEAWLRRELATRRVRYRSFEPKVLFSEPGAKPFVWRQAYSADFLRRTGVRQEEAFTFGEDLLFQFAVFPLAERFSFIPDRLYHYRVCRKGSQTEEMALKRAERAQWHFRIAERVLTLWEGYGIARKYRYELGRWAVQYMLDAILPMDPSGQADALARTMDLVRRHALEDALRELTTSQRRAIRRIRRTAGTGRGKAR